MVIDHNKEAMQYIFFLNKHWWAAHSNRSRQLAALFSLTSFADHTDLNKMDKRNSRSNKALSSEKHLQKITCRIWLKSTRFISIYLFPLDLYQILSYFRTLHDVNFAINLTLAKKFIGRINYHIFHGYSDKNWHFLHINIPQVHLR